MTSDLDRFHEQTLYNSNVRDFCNSLPYHLRSKFEKCLNVDILWGNVLHGYRGPSNMQNGCSDDSGILPPSHGLTEIKFWWGMRKWISGVTLGLAIGIQKAISHLQWSSLYFDSITGECLSQDKNEAAEKLNDRGNQLFERGNYTEAVEYYSNAYNNCNNGQRRIYEANREKAQTEIDAINLCSQADGLFEQDRYSEAKNKYQEAYDKSQVACQRNIYSSKKDKVQNIINILSKLDTLWKEAWDAENDNENNRSDEAKATFQTILSESKNCLNIHHGGNSTLKQYETLATLKIKGNEMFNQGLESLQNGNILFEAAQELKQQETYESAKVKLEEAKNLFHAACEKFEEGSKINQRFLSCTDIVQEQINDVIQSIKSIEQCTTSVRMCNVDIRVADTNRADINSLEFHENEKQSIYIQQI